MGGAPPGRSNGASSELLGLLETPQFRSVALKRQSLFSQRLKLASLSLGHADIYGRLGLRERQALF